MEISLCFNGESEESQFPETGSACGRRYDNDGWLDLWAVGKKSGVAQSRSFRISEQTVQLGPGEFDGGGVSEIHFADFDMDCDSDVIVALANGGLRYLRDEGGNANSQAKVKMV